MTRILDRIRSMLHDRRQQNLPVNADRRKPTNRKQVEKRLLDAIDDFARVTKREEPPAERFVASNDRQQVVIFSTFREVCEFNLPAGEHRLCRHPEHEAANSGIARCEEAICPALNAALKGAA